jgi:hypothetical protein
VFFYEHHHHQSTGFFFATSGNGEPNADNDMNEYFLLLRLLRLVAAAAFKRFSAPFTAIPSPLTDINSLVNGYWNNELLRSTLRRDVSMIKITLPYPNYLLQPEADK